MKEKNQQHSKPEDEGVLDETATMTVEQPVATDNVGDTSVEINVDDLISEVEAAGLPADHFKSEKARKRLEQILEDRRTSQDISDFEDFDFNAD
ncbi:MAG: hypothetical protein ACR2QB_02240 [Gammaproteobacteria bacterium]